MHTLLHFLVLIIKRQANYNVIYGRVHIIVFAVGKQGLLYIRST